MVCCETPFLRPSEVILGRANTASFHLRAAPNQKTFREPYISATWRPVAVQSLDPVSRSKATRRLPFVLATGGKRGWRAYRCHLHPYPRRGNGAGGNSKNWAVVGRNGAGPNDALTKTQSFFFSLFTLLPCAVFLAVRTVRNRTLSAGKISTRWLLFPCTA